jgi:hypothetical protein
VWASGSPPAFLWCWIIGETAKAAVSRRTPNERPASEGGPYKSKRKTAELADSPCAAPTGVAKREKRHGSEDPHYRRNQNNPRPICNPGMWGTRKMADLKFGHYTRKKRPRDLKSELLGTKFRLVDFVLAFISLQRRGIRFISD